eukprot:TRINITY_DN2444_c0_g1_i1.p1 TRINITY_DN2444_c0_g1~~TRINITY_DN2444_c0_g1_i1.p1  ORF type:complete len:345 (-),score=129.34 TRINITY_DN2444_c0_g1_i1:91-1125(-)
MSTKRNEANPTANLYQLLADESTLVVDNNRPKKGQPKKNEVVVEEEKSAVPTPAEKAKQREAKDAANKVKKELKQQSKPESKNTESKQPHKLSRVEWEEKRRLGQLEASASDASTLRGEFRHQGRPQRPRDDREKRLHNEKGERQDRPRGQKREYDRKSGKPTGRNPQGKKSGAGSKNWGVEEKPEHVTAAEGVKLVEEQGEVKEPEVQEPQAPVEPEGESLDAYLKEKEEKQKALQASLVAKYGTVQARVVTGNVDEQKDDDPDLALLRQESKDQKSGSSARNLGPKNVAAELFAEPSRRGRGGKGGRGGQGGRVQGQGGRRRGEKRIVNNNKEFPSLAGAAK